MKSRYVLITVALLCTGFILFALYLQLFWMILPCPLCVLQRYAFIVVGLCALAGLMTRRVRICAFLAFLVSAAGAGLAFYQLWVIAHPQVDGHVSNTLNDREGERPRADPGRPYSAAAKR